jgi:hypothetical protein
MGDLEGALEDLNEDLKPDVDDYEMLKHRGLIKFLLDDKEGACFDAERASVVRPSRVNCHNYGRNLSLGMASVKFLGYLLK